MLCSFFTETILKDLLFPFPTYTQNYIILDKTAIPGAFIPLKTEEMHEYVPFPSSYVYPISFKVHHKICMFSYFKANLCVTQILRVTPGQGQG